MDSSDANCTALAELLLNQKSLRRFLPGLFFLPGDRELAFLYASGVHGLKPKGSEQKGLEHRNSTRLS
jgi:hypothetical protein